MADFKVKVYEDKDKTKERFTGKCIAVDSIYFYCVEEDSDNVEEYLETIYKVSYDRVDYLGDA